MMARLKRLFGRVGGGQAPAPTAEPLRVLMVCSGNICRSPTAEAVLRDKLRQAGLQAQVLVDSAGTHGYHANDAPDPRAQKAAAKRGYDLAQIRARAVQTEDFDRFDYILAMDQANLDWLMRRAPQTHGARLELLLDHARPPSPGAEVPDPYYGAPEGFDHVLDLVERACDSLVPQLAEQCRDPLRQGGVDKAG